MIRKKLLIVVPLITVPLLAILLIAISCCSTNIFEPDISIASKTISLREYFGKEVKGKTLYLIKTNPFQTTIYASQTPYITQTSGIELTKKETSNDYYAEEPSYATSTKATHAVLPMIKASSVALEKHSNRVIDKAIIKDSQVEQIKAVEGETEKEIYIDSDSNISSYKSARAILRAIGENCYVWVIDGFYYSDSTGSHNFTGDYAKYSYTSTSDEQLTQEQVKAFANKFDEIYPLLQDVFGKESDEINYYSDGWIKKPMSYLSDTGTKVNIVLYDIGADHSSDDSSGVLGYFYSRDYYPNGKHINELGYDYSGSYSALKYSNEGKYFYIDAYSAAADPISAYSTIAHEAQHMISYGVKTLEKGIATTTAHEEMMSMLCEDIFQTYLNVVNDESPEARLPFFEGCYRYAGLEYRNESSNYAVLSYATNYAFASWLIRNFGGVDLIREMARNDYEGISCIVSAVNRVNSASYTINDLITMYAKACVLQSYSYTHNKEVYDSKYPLRAIDLWKLGDELSINDEYVKQGYYSYTGCKLYDYNAKYDLRPYGMLLVKVGKIVSDEATINLENTQSKAHYALVAE